MTIDRNALYSNNELFMEERKPMELIQQKRI